MTSQATENTKNKKARSISLSFVLAGVVSLLWIGGTLLYVPTTETSSPLRLGFGSDLNEMGDYLAGAFAPVAFLWLILGYMQQGHELRNSITEMQNSLDEQKEQTKLIKQSSDVSKRSLFLTIAHEIIEEIEDHIKNMASLLRPEWKGSKGEVRKSGGQRYEEGHKHEVILFIIECVSDGGKEWREKRLRNTHQRKRYNNAKNHICYLFEKLCRLAEEADGASGDLVAFYRKDSKIGELYDALKKASDIEVPNES